MKKTLLLAPAVAVAITGLAVGPATVAGATTGINGNFDAVQQTPPGPAAEEINLTVEPQEITAEALVADGVTVTITGLQPESEVTDSLTGQPSEVDADGNVAFAIVYQGDPSELQPGEVTFTVDVTNTDGEADQLDSSFTIVEDDETEEPTEDPSETPSDEPTDEETDEPSETPSDESTDDETDEAAEYALSVDPEEISPEDFVDPDQGVQLTVSGLEVGEEVEFSVAPQGENVEPLTETEDADDEGVAAWTVYGIDDSDPSAYLGDYDVLVTNESGEELEGAFSVTDGAEDDDSDAGEDNGDDDSSLPRTGMELTGLATGAGLLAVGAATVLLTRRRMNQG